MSVNITVPREYGYVVVTTACTFFLGMWHGIRVAGFRRPAEMRYPKPYADSSDMSSADPEKKKAMYLFNCAQRSHGNYLENQPSLAISLLIAGIHYPIATTLMGIGWMACRIAYAIGYTRSDKSDGTGRVVGSGFWLFQLGLFGMSAWSGMKMVM